MFAVVLTTASLLVPSAASAQSTLDVSAPGVGFYTVLGVSPSSQTVSISATPASKSAWAVTNLAELPKWLTVTPANGALPATLTLAVNADKLPCGVHQATVTVSTSGNPATSQRIPVLFAIACPGAARAGFGPSVYAVEISYTGYTGLASGYPDCKVNPKGTDRMFGIVIGNEGVPPGEDVRYSGTLIRLTRIDYCETRGVDELVWCAATLTGTAAMKVDLEVYGEQGRGAYMKARHDGGPFTRSMKGSCDPKDQLIWEKEYPRDDAVKAGESGDEGGGASPNGQPIDDPTSKLFAGGRARLVVGTFPPDRPDGWTLTVIRKIQ